MPFTPPIRPSSGRQRKLGPSGRVKLGGGASPRVTVSTRGTSSERGGGPVLQATRPTLGRDCSKPSSGYGRLCDEEAKLELQKGERRCRSKVEGCSKGQSKAWGASRHDIGKDGGGTEIDGDSVPGGCNTKKAAVPGAEAPTFSVAGFWNSCPRLLTKYSAGLGAFLSSLCSIKPCHRDDDDGTPSVVLWPIPMPYPEVFCSGKFTADGWRPSVASAYNWLWLGRPSTAPGALRFGRKLKQRQWRVVKLLESLAEDGNSPLQVDAAMMGRVASKAENADKELASLHRAAAVLTGQGSDKMYSRLNSGLGGLPSDAEYDDFRFGVFEGCLKQEKFVAAKPVEADRLTFVGTPQFDPSDLFDQRTYEVYADPLQHAVVDENFEPPLVKILATPDEKVKLLRKLATTGRLLLLSEQECDMKYSAGLFSVVKDLSKDRLILDARPSNGRERAVGTWTSTLASPSTLAQIELLPGEILLRSGQDLRDYFYQFRVTADRARRNCLAGVLGRSEIDAIFGVDARPELTTGVAALNTLAMGDCSACDFAQGAHLMLLLTCNAAFVPELLLGRKPPPRGLLSIEAVIDDLVMLERVLKRDLQQIKEGAVKTQADGRIKRALDGYSRAHLETNPKKAFHNTPLCSFWGIELDGERGVIRPSSSRLLLIGITFRVCCLGLATCSLLQSLAGSWISVFLVRRRTMSSMNLIFDAIGCSENGGQVIRLSEELIDELFTYCFLGSLCWVNLRASTNGSIRATDASDWGMAGVCSEQPVSQGILPSCNSEECVVAVAPS